MSIVNEFIELIKIDVESKNERKLADKVIEKLKIIGCEVIEDDTKDKIGGNTGNIIARLKGNKEYSILLSAHLDRVSKGRNIKPRIVQNKILSDGTTILAADDVAGIVSILDGLRKAKELRDRCNIEVIFSVCEEKGVTGSKYIDYSKLNSKIAYVFDSPGNIGRVINQAPTKCVIDVEFFGKPAHAGNEPEKGINAIKILAKSLSKINEGRINKYTTSNFGIVSGGKATNVVCDYVKLTGEARSRDNEDLDKYLEYIKRVFNETAKENNTKVNININRNYETFHIKEEENISKLLIKAMENLNIKWEFTPGGGGMDANRFNNNGIKAVGIATGYKNNHTFKEEININDLKKAGDLVKEIIIEASKLD